MDPLREKFNKAVADAEALFDKAKAEGRELTQEECVTRDKLFADIRGMKGTMESAKELAAMAFQKGETDVTVPAGKSKAQLEAEGRGVDADSKEKQREKYNHFLRTGDSRQLYTITTGTDSGALVPVAVDVPDIVRRMYNSVVAAITAKGYQTINTPTAENLIIPVVDDSSVLGDTPSESASSDTETDPTVTNMTLGATLFSSQSIWLSNTMINTVGFDLVGYLMPLLDKRVELKEDLAWITKLLTKVSGGNALTAALATAFTYDELVKTYHTLSIPYRSDAVWIVSDTFLQAVRLLKDSNARPLFNFLDPLVNAGAIGTLMGCPVFTSLNMPTVAANHVPAFFGSAECLKARFVTNRRIARYTNIPTFPDQVGFRLFENADADFNPAGLAYLKMAIS